MWLLFGVIMLCIGLVVRVVCMVGEVLVASRVWVGWVMFCRLMIVFCNVFVWLVGCFGVVVVCFSSSVFLVSMSSVLMLVVILIIVSCF